MGKATAYKPIETFSKVAVAADASVDYVEFEVANAPKGMIAQILSVTTGAANTTGLAVTYAAGKVKVAATSIAVGDTVSLICF